MKIHWTPRGVAPKIIAAVVVAAIAAPLRVLLADVIGPGTPFLIFTPAVMAAALYGGVLSGLTATFLLTLAAALQGRPGGCATQPALLVFAVSGVLFSWLAEALHRLRHRTTKAEAEATFAVQACKLNDAKRQLAAIVESTDDAIVGTDLAGRITSWNRGAEQLYGYGAGEMAGQPATLLCSSACPDEFPMLLRRVLAGRNVKNFETRRRHKNGTTLDVAITLSAIRDEAEAITGASAVIRDITARKRMETLRTDMERITRHDLKTPLNAIINLPLLLMSAPNLTPEQHDYARMIHEAGLRMLEQIDQTLTLYRIETGSYELRPQPVDLPALARQVAVDLAEQSRELGVDLRVEAGEEPILSSGDPLLCRTMLANLMKNAIEASPKGKTACARIARTDGRAEIVIRNDGSVPRAVRPRFFEKDVTHGKKNGMGLGTYSARLSAEAQHGDIAMSTSQEAGTAVTVRLPLWSGTLPPPGGPQ